MFFFPLWLQVVWFVICNLPSILRLLNEIRKLNSDLPKEERMRAMDECKEDIDEYIKTKDRAKLRARLEAKRDMFRARRAEREERRRERRGSK